MKGISSGGANTNSPEETMLQRLRAQIEEMRKEITQQAGNEAMKKLSGKKINLTAHMIRLANAKTRRQVDGVIRAVQAEARAVSGSGATKQEIAAARRAARKVGDKGAVKIYRLRREEALHRLSEQYKRAKKLEESLDTLKELKSKRRARKAAENQDVVDSMKPDPMEDAYSQMDADAAMNAEFAVSIDVAGTEVNLLAGTSADTSSINLLM